MRAFKVNSRRKAVIFSPIKIRYLFLADKIRPDIVIQIGKLGVDIDEDMNL